MPVPEQDTLQHLEAIMGRIHAKQHTSELGRGDPQAPSKWRRAPELAPGGSSEIIPAETAAEVPITQYSKHAVCLAL